MISVLIKSAEQFGIDKRKVEEKVFQVLRRISEKEPRKWAGNLEVGVVFVDPAKIRKLNKKYRNLDRPTSILSFSQQERSGPGEKGQADFPAAPDGIKRLGDIVVCPKEARKQNLTILFLIKHGLKHLLKTE